MIPKQLGDVQLFSLLQWYSCGSSCLSMVRLHLRQSSQWCGCTFPRSGIVFFFWKYSPQWHGYGSSCLSMVRLHLRQFFQWYGCTFPCSGMVFFFWRYSPQWNDCGSSCLSMMQLHLWQSFQWCGCTFPWSGKMIFFLLKGAAALVFAFNGASFPSVAKCFLTLSTCWKPSQRCDCTSSSTQNTKLSFGLNGAAIDPLSILPLPFFSFSLIFSQSLSDSSPATVMEDTGGKVSSSSPSGSPSILSQ